MKIIKHWLHLDHIINKYYILFITGEELEDQINKNRSKTTGIIISIKEKDIKITDIIPNIEDKLIPSLDKNKLYKIELIQHSGTDVFRFYKVVTIDLPKNDKEIQNLEQNIDALDIFKEELFTYANNYNLWIKIYQNITEDWTELYNSLLHLEQTENDKE